ncbi:MAG TPA: hypothetical protein VJU86_00140 [Pyrinomonadaceae bacterium]|nr:hypothetical protein [Pyrinomonadaceae bacterium]
MRTRSFGKYMSIAMVLLCLMVSSFVAQQPRKRPAATPAQVNNLKITYKTSAAGQTSESSTLIRGSRERTETKLGGGMEMISITQCDLKRTVQLSDTAKKYVITPMDTGSSSTATGTKTGTAGDPSTRGGVVTYTTTSIDTGERREMFGFTARHVKTTTTMQSSPDACTPVNQKIERDGWYIDFSYGLTCELNRSQMMGTPSAQGGCQDRYQFKQVGTGRDGYPLTETTTMYGPDGQAMFSSTKEVVELSREPLDPSLFDIPAGYTETTNSQELYMPATTGSMDHQGSQSQEDQQTSSEVAAASASSEMSVIRVGVVQLNNKSGRDISLESLRERLMGNLHGSGIEAVPLNALTASDAIIEAKAKGCAFVLLTDIAAVKANKLGGMFGRVTGASGAGKTESKIEFKLFAVSEGSPRIQSTASAKEEGDETSVGMAIDQEATIVKGEVLKSIR